MIFNKKVSIMNALPDEVLMHLFSLMPTLQRNRIRLVCRRWNQICNVASISNLEKLVIPDIFGFSPEEAESVFEILMRNQRRILNLEFYFLKMLGLFSEECQQTNFWRKQGSSIRSLTFIECEIVDDKLIEILKCCPNITKLNFTFPSGNPSSVRLFMTNMNFLLSFGFVATTIGSFKLTAFDENMLSNYLINLIFSVFPNLTELELSISGCCDSLAKNTHEVDLLHPIKFSFASLAHFINLSGSKLKTLNLKLFPKYVTSELSDDTLNLLASLKQLEIVGIFGLINKVSCHSIEQLWSLKNITSLKFVDLSFGETGYSFRSFILRAMDSFPRLRHLNLGDVCESEIDKILIDRILDSCLKTLKFSFKRSIEKIGHVNPDENFVRNDSLEEITLDGYGIYEVLWCILIRNVKNLRHICMEYSTDAILQEICKYQKGLRSLCLQHGRFYTNFGFTGIRDIIDDDKEQSEGYSFRELKGNVQLAAMATNSLLKKASGNKSLQKLYDPLSPPIQEDSDALFYKHFSEYS